MMDSQTALLLGLLVGFVAGWSVFRACMRAHIEHARKAVAKLSTSVADLSNAQWRAGFAAGVDAYPQLDDKGRQDVLNAWLHVE